MPKKTEKAEKTEEPGKAVTNWEQQMAAEAKAVAKTERTSSAKITFKSGIMSYMDNAIPDNTMDVIVLAHAVERVFYSEAYDSDNIVPPDCFALALPGEELIPHDVVPEPIATACEVCPYDEWGSGKGRGKKCGERRRLAVIPAPDGPDDIAGSDMASMSIPVMSIKNWANYVNLVAATSQRPPWGVVTTVSLKPDPKSQFRVHFEKADVLSSDYLPHISQRIAMAQTMLMTPYEMSQEPKEEVADSGKY